MTIFTRFLETVVQKSQYLQLFSNISGRKCAKTTIFTRFLETVAQKSQYLQWFSNISGRKHAKTTIFTRFLETVVQKSQYLQWFSNISGRKHAKTTIFIRNHATRTQGYGSVLLDFPMSVYSNLWIRFLLWCAIRETEWAHKINCTYRIPERIYRVHTAFLKPDFSGLWVWTPN